MSSTSYIVSESFNDTYLSDFFKYYHASKAKLKNLKIYVNEKEISKDIKIFNGDIITILDDEKIDFLPLDKKLDIAYEDDYLLIINKPNGVMVHPDMKDKNGCLVNMVAKYYKDNNINRTIKYLHRIDTDTTGLIMFAKDLLTASYLNYLISIHEIKRSYLAIVSGHLDKEKGTISAPIGEDRHHNQRRRVSKTGKEAITHYEVIQELKHNYSLVKLDLETGRTHQIRVHMKYIGHPLAGDELYGGSLKYIKRQALHSYELNFLHPYTKNPIHIIAPIPFDMKKLIED